MIFWLTQPTMLAGCVTCSAAFGSTAVMLRVYGSWVCVEPFSAIHALTMSKLCHVLSPLIRSVVIDKMANPVIQ